MDAKTFLFKCYERFWILFRWVLCAGLAGMIIGLVAGLFGQGIVLVTNYRLSHPWMLYLLPLAGLIIVAVYKKWDPCIQGTNRVLENIQSGKSIRLRVAPLIIFSTLMTHAFGGSAGREGAALQLGGSLGRFLGQTFHMDEKDVKIMVMTGMSAAFSALFGTPLTATVFAMEVTSVGIMQYAALVPCAFAALLGRSMAYWIGVKGEHFAIPTGIDLSLKNALLVIVLAVLCALLGIVFCKTLHITEGLYKKYITNDYLRPIMGAFLIIFLTLLLGTRDYLGAGMNIIEAAIEGEALPTAFLMKIIFTSITLAVGFKGGEIVPTLFIGATFGCIFGQVTGFSPSLAAACGMVAVFCGVTNCPMSSLFLSFELFGFECMPFFLLAISVSYLESGYTGLYHSQKILYSKTELTFINRITKE